MLTILHGDNTLESRSELIKLKNSHSEQEIRVIDGKHNDMTQLLQSVESLSLFDQKPLVIVEQLLSSLGKKKKELEAVMSLLSRNAKDVDIILWESKEISKTMLAAFPAASVRGFPFPKILFTFLDNIKPQNTKQLLTLYQQLEEHEPAELVYFMTVSRVRQLIEVKDGITPSGMASWNYGRLTNQAKFFTMEQLLLMHKTLLQYEYTLKTGSSAFNLSQLITQFLLGIDKGGTI